MGKLLGFLNDTYGNHEYYTPVELSIEIRRRNRIDIAEEFSMSGSVWQPADYPNDDDIDMEFESMDGAMTDEEWQNAAKRAGMSVKELQRKYAEDTERDCISAGQIIDDLVEYMAKGEFKLCYLTKEELTELADIWKKYHLKQIPPKVSKRVRELEAKLPEFTYSNESAGKVSNFNAEA